MRLFAKLIIYTLENFFCMPISYGILAFRKLSEPRVEKCLVRPLRLPECTDCLNKLNQTNRFLHPSVYRVLEKEQIQLLCILRRDTHALVDLLRGRYEGTCIPPFTP